MNASSVPKPAATPIRARVQELLSHAPIFRDLSPEELARIAAGSREVRTERGQMLFQRGDPCTGFHIVVFGHVKLTVGSPAGAERVVDILGPGATFGEALMFTERPYVVSATVLADSLLLHVAKDTLFAEIEGDPKLARRMLAGLSWRLHMLVKDVEALTVHSATQRVIGYLARLQDEAGAGRVSLPAQKSLVASRLNLTPEYFSRILHQLEDDGVIRIEGRDIEVLDAQRLARYGDEAAAQ